MTDYNKFKVTELKELLKERGIRSTGLSRKQQIIEALEKQDASATAEDAQAEGEENVSVEKVSDDVPNLKQAPAQKEGEEDGDGLEAAVAVENVGAVEGSGMGSPPIPTDSIVQRPSAPADEPSSEAPAMEEKSTSPAAESRSSDIRKRKRRSPTPPPSEETIQKKLKTAEEEPVTLPEDRVVEDAPVPMDGITEDERVEEGTTVVPYSVSDDVLEVTDKPLSSEPGWSSHDGRPPSRSYMEERAARLKEETKQPSAPDTTVEGLSDDTVTSSATHPATRSLYIRELVRPLQPLQLQDHLARLATPPSSNLSERVIETFHLDSMRTHAFVTFTSISAATRARSALHGHTWPDEPTRKPLWVEFVPDGKVQDWIDTEVNSGSSKRDARKWEVVYNKTDDGVTATLQEMAPTAPVPTGPMRQPSFSSSLAPIGSGAGTGMPTAPLGPRASRPSVSKTQPPPPMKKPAPASSSASFDILNTRFNSTTTKPKLYYLPVSKDIVNERLDELDAQTSRTWDSGRAMHGISAVEGQPRRYTFEDGGRIVDNGPDHGAGSREPRGGRGGGRGYRGGGGWRGRR